MSLKEIAIVSGKGGTGKTTLLASMIPYFDNMVLADCDVDAPDLHILMEEEDLDQQDFVGLQRPVIDLDKCIHCMKCVNHCRFDALTDDIQLLTAKCEGCAVCELVCPTGAIVMEDYAVGKITRSQTPYGKMVHARLIPGEETSGKLVAEVRNKAKETAQKEEADWILIDGSPGIACNVIASITGVDTVLIVIEPTLAGLHDLERVYDLVKRFSTEVMVVLNKSDLSDKGRQGILDFCQKKDIELILEIPFERALVEAVVEKELPSLYAADFFKTIGFEDMIKAVKGE